MTIYGKIGHNVACVNVGKRSIEFLKITKGTVRSNIAKTTKGTAIKLGGLNIWMPTNA